MAGSGSIPCVLCTGQRLRTGGAGRQAWLVALWLGLIAGMLCAAETPGGTRSTLPPMPPPSSPVDFFRELLAMRPAEREQALSNRTEAVKARILAKVREYEALPAEERELRLRATELRWFLTSLMQQPPDRRPPLDQVVPAHLRQAVADRLAIWDALPEPVRYQFLRDELALNYFSRVPRLPQGGGAAEPMRVAVRTGAPPPPPDDTDARLEGRDLREVARQLRRLFEWTPEERQKALATLSESERRQIEESLRRFEQLPGDQRRRVIASFERLARMTPAERRAFLQNAERWSAMSPSERERWRRLVQQVPELPPLPPGFYEAQPPPLPPGAGQPSVSHPASNAVPLP